MFNVGDKVRCISNRYRLINKDDILEVLYMDGGFVKFKGIAADYGVDFIAKDFELVERFKEKADTTMKVSASDLNININEAAKIIKNTVQKLNEELKEKIDNVNHPIHYNKGNIEVIDYIEDKELNFNLGNAIKYISRCNHKGRKKEDLEKAIWYLQREINTKISKL